MTDPIEVTPPTVSGLSADQMQALYRAPYIDHIFRSPKLGSGSPRTIVNGVGLFFGGVNPIGDFSGTAQFIDEADTVAGSGGPWAIPYGPTAAYGIHAAGRCWNLTGNALTTTTSVAVEKPFSASDNPASLSHTFKVKWRKMTSKVISWNGSAIAAGVTNDPSIPACPFVAATIGSPYPTVAAPATESFSAVYTFTGDDWLVVRSVAAAGTQVCATGWYRIKSFDAATETFTLTEDASIICPINSTVDCFVVQSAQAKYLGLDGGAPPTGATWTDATQLEFNGGAPVNGDTLVIGGTTYTFTTGTPAANEIPIGSRAATILSTVAMLQTDSRVEVLDYSAVNTDNCFIDFRAATRTTYAISTGGSGRVVVSGSEISRGKIYRLGAFDALASTDDTVEILSSSTTDTSIFAKIVDGDANTLWVDASRLFGNGDDQLTLIHWKRNQWVEKTVDNAACTTTKLAWTGTLGTSHGWNNDAPKRGDMYIMWIDTPVGVTPVHYNNPEATPTYTQANNTCAGMWPYWQPVRTEAARMPSNYNNYPDAKKDTQVNHAYNGLFTIPAETFLAGDRLRITTLSDFQGYGQPVVFEVLVLFDFDPEADWLKSPDYDANSKLVQAGSARGVAFQTKPIKVRNGDHGIRITIEGQAGTLQTSDADESGDNYSQQWTMKLEVYQDPDDFGGQGGNAGSALAMHPDSGYTVGPIAHINTTAEVAIASVNMRASVMIKCEHPSMRNRVGYHGYYGGEPFSCTTGTGGTLLVGTQGYGAARMEDAVTPALPYMPNWRCASVDVEWTPGGSFA